MGSADLAEENKDDPMSLAFTEARSAELRGEAPIGAALVRDGTVIASAGNRTRELSDPTAHAEMIVIREAAAKLGSERLVGCDLYVTLEPCAMCAGAISLRPAAPTLLCCSRSQGRRCRSWAALLWLANLPPCAGGLRRLTRGRGSGNAESVFRLAAVNQPVGARPDTRPRPQVETVIVAPPRRRLPTLRPP